MNTKADYCLSNEDIIRLIPFEVPIYHYSELKNINSVFEMVHPNNAAIIYYETERDGGCMMGHWTCLTLSPKSRTVKSNNDLSFSVNFFDSYGLEPDEQKEKINDWQLKISGMIKDTLTKLLYDSSDDITVEYNEQPLQKRNIKVNTCGRHCVCRIMAVDMPLDKYQKFMRLKGTTPDDKVIEITNLILTGKKSAEEVANTLNEMINEMI